jgi:hypothetical protein
MYSAFVSTGARVVSPSKCGVDPFRERVVKLAQCEVCGNEYDKALGIPDTQAPPMLTISLTA